MKVHKIDSTKFQSRNQTIRFADDIARHVNKCYPRISATMVNEFVNINAFRNLKKRLNADMGNKLRAEISHYYDSADNFMEKILAFIKPIKKYKLGNCGESAQLAAIVAKINGIKDCHIAQICNHEAKDLDHSVLFVNEKKPYIIDCWLGFADYAPNALNKYKTLYNKIFKLKDNNQLTFYTNINDEYTDFLKDDFTRSQINKLRRIYSELYIKKGYV
jgi:hypothetical protein